MAKENFIGKLKGLGLIKDNKEIILFDENKPKNIVKAIEGKEETPDIVFLSELLYNEVFKNSGELIDMPIEAVRVILTILHYSKQIHFNQPNAPYTPSLFEEEFLTKENTYVTICIPNTIISPSREIKRIKEALDVLTSKTSRWVSSKNLKGEVVQTKISFIERPSYTRGKVKFEVSSFWIEKLANIEHYNKIFFSLVYNLPNTRQLIFTIWLNTLPLYKADKLDKGTFKSWTNVKTETLQSKFNLLDKDHNYIAEKFLKPLQNKLFKFNDRSFAFQYEKGHFYITAINVKSNAIINHLSQKDSYQVEIKYAISYLQRRHKVDLASLDHISTIYRNSKKDKEIMETAYKALKAKTRKSKRKMTDLTGMKFLDEWQVEIINIYFKTDQYKNFPSAYPKINTAH